jgi:hypothetical protein
MTARAYIPYPQRLAAALACLLPQWQRDYLRRHKVDAGVVERLFHFHHIEAHANGGSSAWHNLHPMLIQLHHELTRKIDIPRIAKGKRIARKHEEFRRRILAKGQSTPPPSRWPKRSFRRQP